MPESWLFNLATGVLYAWCAGLGLGVGMPWWIVVWTMVLSLLNVAIVVCDTKRAMGLGCDEVDW